MPFIPHTKKDTDEMLAVIGAPDLEALFDEIPTELRIDSEMNLHPFTTFTSITSRV